MFELIPSRELSGENGIFSPKSPYTGTTTNRKCLLIRTTDVVTRQYHMKISKRRFTNLLAFAALATYVLILVGATVSLRDLASACGTWPTCEGALIVAPGEEAFLPWAHRLVALLVGGVVTATAVGAYVADVPRKVFLAVVVALLLYPVQVVLGGITVLTDPEAMSAIHLSVAMVIFSSLLIALTWTLGVTTRGKVETGNKTPEPNQSDDSNPAVFRSGFSMTKP